MDLTNDIARERGLTIDEAGFEAAMDEQRTRARAATSSGSTCAAGVTIEGATAFTGYEHERSSGRIVALFRGQDAVPELRAGEEGQVVLDPTPFYAESGGEVGDRGETRGRA